MLKGEAKDLVCETVAEVQCLHLVEELCRDIDTIYESISNGTCETCKQYDKDAEWCWKYDSSRDIDDGCIKGWEDKNE